LSVRVAEGRFTVLSDVDVVIVLNRTLSSEGVNRLRRWCVLEW